MADFRRGDTAGWDREQVRRSQAEQQRPQPVKKKKKRKKKGVNPLIRVILWFVFVGLSSAILAGSGWLLLSDLCAFNRGGIQKFAAARRIAGSQGGFCSQQQFRGVIRQGIYQFGGGGDFSSVA